MSCRKAYKRGGRTLQEESDDRSWSESIKNLWSVLTSDEHLPKRFRNFIRDHGRDKIERIQVVRAPVTKLGDQAMQLITAGKWDEFRKKAGMDAAFHTSITINGNLVVEKLLGLEGRVDPNYISKERNAEAIDIPLHGKEMTVAEFLENGRKQMGKKFYTYHFLDSNCQDWVMAMLSSNGLLNAEARDWLKQDIEKLAHLLPAVSKKAGVALTDVGRNLGNVYEELVYKRGGQIHGFQGGRRRGF